MRDVRPFIRDGFGCAETAPCCVLRAFNSEEVASLLAGAELRANMGIGRLSHAVPQRIAHERPLVDNSLPLEVAAASISNGFFRP